MRLRSPGVWAFNVTFGLTVVSNLRFLLDTEAVTDGVWTVVWAVARPTCTDECCVG